MLVIRCLRCIMIVLFHFSIHQNMAFAKPFPVVPKRQTQSLCIEDKNTTGMPGFRKCDYQQHVVIGMGSFGKVTRVHSEGKNYVIKEFANSDASVMERQLFVKEAKLLWSLSGCENVVQFFAFSTADCAILLEYCCFSFASLQLERNPVFNLKDFMIACDELTDCVGFEHVQLPIARDIACGLAYLHTKNVAHRDLKPNNILVTNQHYSDELDTNRIRAMWTNKPVIAKLSDFGESRAILIQTQTVLRSRTHNMIRGSPAYMAPEALTGSVESASLSDLKAMDVWSAGMTFYHLLNPSARYPFAEYIDNHTRIPVVDQLTSCLLQAKLPTHVAKYRDMQVSL